MGKCSLLSVTIHVYTRSSAAYEALSSFHLLQLTYTRALKMYIHSNVECAGEAEVQQADER